MRKKGLIILGGLLICFKISFGQTKKHLNRKKDNPFEMVHVDDSIRKKLVDFIWKREKDSTEIGSGVLIHRILMKDKSTNNQFVDGIYWFKLIGTHSNLYYFIYTHENGLQIIKDYSVENIFLEVLEYFRKSGSQLNEIDKLNYIQSILNDLKYKNNTLKTGFYGDYEIK